ncbi:MAG TPA: hypothetical protein VK716_18180 [Terracidiphilus sp.]|jgi:hypothetical protein|nr:hypothetical protein [Terracidiphilus sp.]
MSPDTITLMTAEEPSETNTLKVLGWFSVGMAVAALSFWVGRELRNRYKFNQRTPYDFYSNAAEPQSAEYGMGV